MTITCPASIKHDRFVASKPREHNYWEVDTNGKTQKDLGSDDVKQTSYVCKTCGKDAVKH